MLTLPEIVRRKTVWQGQRKTGEQCCFHCGPSVRVKQEQKNQKYLMKRKSIFMIAKA